MFKINEFLTLKLEDNETTIYVKEKPFKQCKYLFFTITEEINNKIKHLDSIDEIAESLDSGHENDHSLITPEEEFWGHCSNLQAWYENNYDSRLLHSNLSFPLLKKLSEAGDPLAKRVFKREIIERIVVGYKPVIQFLIEENYLDVFSDDEFMQLFEENKQNLGIHYKIIRRLLKIDQKLAYFLIYGSYIRLQKAMEAWDAAWYAAWYVARDGAWDAARDGARDAAWDGAWDAWEAAQAARDVAWEAARYAAWEGAWDAAREEHIPFNPRMGGKVWDARRKCWKAIKISLRCL